MSVYYNDNDPYCCRVLRKQIAEGNIPRGHVDGRDIRDVQVGDLDGYRQIHLFAGIGGFPLGFKRAGVPDDFSICTGGFPCQDISIASADRGGGIDGERSGLWREMVRIVRLVRPRLVLVENVPNIVSRGWGLVSGELARIGYDATWSCIPASAVGAQVVGQRFFAVAAPSGQRCEAGRILDRVLAESPSPEEGQAEWDGILDRGDGTVLRRIPHPGVCRVADGVPRGLDRIRCLGNAVVPQIAEWLGRRILEVDHF